jgi:hypothetical protein
MSRTPRSPAEDDKIRRFALSGASLGEIAAQVARNPLVHPTDLKMRQLDMDSSIRLRWALRDIKSKRTKWTPVSPVDLRTLIEMGLVEMRGELPVITNEGERAIDWS